MGRSGWGQVRFTRHGCAALVATALAASLVVTGCGGDDSGASSEGESVELRMGGVEPLTGALSPFGPPGRKAEDLAVDQMKQAISATGIGMEVSIEHADGETDPQAAVQAVRKLLADDPGCILGAWTSGNTLAVAKSVTIRERMPLIAPSATNPTITDLEDDDFVWRTSASDALGAVALANLVEDRIGSAAGKTVSLAGRNDDYGEGFITMFKANWEQRGGKTTGPVLYDPDQPSFGAEASQIVAGAPDAFVIIDYPETYAKLGPALVRTGKFDPKLMFSANPLGSVAEGDKFATNIPTDAIVGASGHRPWTPASSDTSSAFNDLYTSASGPKRNTYDGQAFDAAMLCFLASVAADSGDPQDINDKIRDVSGPPGQRFSYLELPDAIRALGKGQDIDYDGVSGPIDFDEAGDPSSAYFQVWTYGAGAILKVVGEVAATVE